MRKLIFISIIALAALNSCNMGFGSTELKQKNDSLFIASAEKDRKFNELVEALVEIDGNLAQIKEKENIIALNANEANNNEKITDQINEDIKLIYDLMVQNQEKIAMLEKQLRNSNLDNANMKKLIASLNQQLVEKSAEIVMLNEQLKLKNIEISDLNFHIQGMTQSLDSVTNVSTKTAAKLDETTVALYKAYYVVGTSKELTDKKIINKEGFMNLKKAVMTKEFDTEYFEEIDVRNISTIATNSKKVKLLSSHPENSYKLTTGSDDIITLEILNSEKFWSVSKFLVVQTN